MSEISNKNLNKPSGKNQQRSSRHTTIPITFINKSNRDTKSIAEDVARVINQRTKPRRVTIHHDGIGAKANGSKNPKSVGCASPPTCSNQKLHEGKKKADPLDIEIKLLALSPSKLTAKERKSREKAMEKYLALLDSESDSDIDESGSDIDESGSDIDESGSDIDDTSFNSENGSCGSDSNSDSFEYTEPDFSEYTLNSYSGDSDSVQGTESTNDDNEDEKGSEKGSATSTAAKRKSIEGDAAFESKKSKKSQSPATCNEIEKKILTNIKLEPLSPPSSVLKSNSITEGAKAFEWLIQPLSKEDFFNKFWEKGSVLTKRSQKNYFSHFISFKSIGEMILNNHVEFGKHIDIIKYKNGKEEILNPEGRALPRTIWDFYGKGCTIRLMNPQTFTPSLHHYCATLQEYFACRIDVNAYLTPAGTQMNPPQIQDFETFILQVEGCQTWRLFKSNKISDYWPRQPSSNIRHSEIGELVITEVLNPGDILYFPRGIIHQAAPDREKNSLHITLGVYRKQSFADLFEKMVPMMLESAIEKCADIRKGLPLDLWYNAGLAYSGTDSEERVQLQEKIGKLVRKCFTSVAMEPLIDQAVDQLAKRFQSQAMPPVLHNHEKARSVFGTRNYTDDSGAWVCDYELDIRTNVRLLRANIIRLVKEEGKLRLYHYLDNSKDCSELNSNYIEIARKDAACVEVLIRSYPEYVSVSQMPTKNDAKKISFVTSLWEQGLIIVEKPLKKA